MAHAHAIRYILYTPLFSEPLAALTQAKTRNLDCCPNPPLHMFRSVDTSNMPVEVATTTSKEFAKPNL